MNNIKKFYTEIDYKNIGERIKSLRGLKSQEDFAKDFGLSQVDVSRIERGEVKPSTEILYNICIKYEKDLAWILTGEETDLIISEPAMPYGEFVSIPQVRGKISAGTGLIPDETIEMRIAFRRDWIERKGDPKNMSIIKVIGDSMDPTLVSGDLVLVDHNKNYLEPPGGIYAIFINDIIVVKRLQVLYPAEKVRIISDNSLYDPIEVDLEQIRVNGKVIWFGRELER